MGRARTVGMARPTAAAATRPVGTATSVARERGADSRVVMGAVLAG
jgi:hypothetical protein